MEAILKYLAMINWLIGIVLSFLSSASFIIKPNEVSRKGWRKNIRGYTIKEIRFVINNSDDLIRIKKLKRKIIYRILYPFFLLSTIVLIIIANS